MNTLPKPRVPQRKPEMKEVCLILSGESIVRISIGSATAIPDSSKRWDAIWENRGGLTEIVHTHPGGRLQFSTEDLTTMQAVEAALGKPLHWSIVTEESCLTRFDGVDHRRDDTPWWLPVLREISFGRTISPAPETQRGGEHASID